MQPRNRNSRAGGGRRGAARHRCAAPGRRWPWACWVRGPSACSGCGRGWTADSAVVRAATVNLTGRGLTAAAGLLVVADGRAALDAAVQRAWGEPALVARRERFVTAEVLRVPAAIAPSGDPAPARSRASASALRRATASPTPALPPWLRRWARPIAHGVPTRQARQRRRRCDLAPPPQRAIRPWLLRRHGRPSPSRPEMTAVPQGLQN